MQKTQNRRIYYKNIYVKRRLLQSEIDIFSIIAHGLETHTPKRQVLLQIKDRIRAIAQDLRLDDIETSHLWSYALSRYNQISRKTFGGLTRLRHQAELGKAQDSPETRRDVIYSAIRAYILNNDLDKAANELMYEVEHRQKHDYVYGQGGLLQTASSPFFLASAHHHAAKDHVAWQGKMYYDEDWEEKNDYTNQEKDAIRAYIRNHKLHTIQFVTGEGIWFGLRRNCNHYFRNIPLEEVLHSSVRKLIKAHHMIHESSGSKPRAVLYYRTYYNRSKMLAALSKEIPNQQITHDLKESNNFKNKWKKMLTSK